ncbi:hypothetical protein Q8G37_26220 [Bacillus wiedmannii]|nr:hypothetical protein [Bacillus wiedmannii]MDP1459887.1 hypothetical protein [Bacillus wiedmannii]
MKAQQAIELILHSGLRKYKYKNSRASIAMLVLLQSLKKHQPAYKIRL